MLGLAALVDALVPDTCPGCEGLRGLDPTGLCTACRACVGTLPRPGLAPWPLAGAWSLGPHDGPLGAAVRRGKYRPDPLLVDALGALLGGVAAGRLPRVDAVVPVPVHWRRRLGRGFDQGARLAAPVARALDRPLLHPLRRVQHGDQAGRGEAARRVGARGVFQARGPLPPRLLLVDDVCTTGATAAACATELLGAGARRIHLLTVTATDTYQD